MTNEKENSLNKSRQNSFLEKRGYSGEALPPPSWDERVITNSVQSLTGTLLDSGLSHFPQINTVPTDDGAVRMLENMYQLDRELDPERIQTDENYADSVLTKRGEYYTGLAREIKRGQRYYILESLISAMTRDKRLDGQVGKKMAIDVGTLHLMLGREDKLLVGLRGGVLWKRIEWPEKDGYIPLLATAYHYLLLTPYIGRRELDFVAEKPLTPSDLEKVRLPQPAQSIDETLEQAYHEQRYVIPTSGAEVRFRSAGDMEKMMLIQTGKTIFAKIEFNNGSNTFAGIDLERGIDVSQLRPELTGRILAEVYRDMVTARVVHSNRPRRLRNLPPLDIDREAPQQSPQIIYIPRNILVRDGDDFRSPYRGPARPVSPYRVTGHRRRANMTEKHRQELIRFEQENSISILENLPAGFTFVKPHMVPSGSKFDELPIFVKRRIEQRLRDDLQRPAVAHSAEEGISAESETENSNF